MCRTLFRITAALFAFTVIATPGFAANILTINTTTSTCGGRQPGKVWEITNGALDICFYLARANIIDMYPLGTGDNLVDQTQTAGGVPKGFYMDNAGLGTATGVPGYDATDKYIGW